MSDRSGQHRVDAERLAALLDGRLDERARAALLAEVAESDDAQSTLADVAAVLRDLEEAGDIPAADLPQPDRSPPGTPLPTLGLLGTAVPTPPATPSPVAPPPDIRGQASGSDAHDTPNVIVRRRTPRWGMLAAAGVLAAVGLSVYRYAGAPTADDPAAYVALLGADTPAPGVAPPWSVTRGPGSSLAPRARAVRFGATAAALALAARARDSSVGPLAGEIAALLDDTPGGATASQLYRAVASSAGAPDDSLAALLDQGWASGFVILGREDARAGAWLQTARVAAARRDAAFFRRRASGRAIDALDASSSGDGAAIRASLARLRAATETPGAPAWEPLGRVLDELLVLLAG